MTSLRTLKFIAALAGISFMTSAPLHAQGLSLLSGNTGGSWYAIGAGISQVLTNNGVRTEVEQGGGISNVIALNTREDAVGFTNAFVLPMAQSAEEPFAEPVENVVAVAVLMLNFGQFVVSADSGVDSFADLKGKAYISQPMSASSTTAFEKVLNAYGLSEADLNISRGDMAYGAEALRDGRALGFHATTAFPNGTISELSLTRDLKLLSVPDDVLKKIIEDNAGFSRGVIPAGTYSGQNEPVETIRAATILIANRDADDEAIYQLVKALAENLDDVRAVHASLGDLAVDGMADLGALEVHPGARRFYEERGL